MSHRVSGVINTLYYLRLCSNGRRKEGQTEEEGRRGSGGAGGQKASKPKSQGRSEVSGMGTDDDPMMMEEVMDDLEDLEMGESEESQTDVQPQAVSQETVEEGEKEEVKSKLTAPGTVPVLPSIFIPISVH